MATTSIPHRVNVVGFVGVGHNEIAVACEGSTDEPARLEKRSVLDLSLVWSYHPKRSSITASRTTATAITTRQRGGGGRAFVDAVTSLDFLPSWDNPYGVLATGDSSGTVSLHTLPKYELFIRETKAHDRFDIGELGHKVGYKVAEGTREMRRQIATRAVQAKDLAVEALDEAKVLVDDVKNLPVIKGIVGFFSR